METPIGRVFKSSRWLLWITTALGIAVVGCDMAFGRIQPVNNLSLYGLPAVVVLFSSFVAVRTRDRASFGLRLSPLQSWTYWLKVTVVLGAIVFGILVAATAFAFGILHYSVPRPRYIVHESQIAPTFVLMCITAPLTEEMIYRLAICPPVTAWFGPRAAIGVSGAAFAAAHIIGGNPGPDNQIAGFLLAWAYLRSGSLVVPIVLHSLGNLCAFVIHVSLFYCTS